MIWYKKKFLLKNPVLIDGLSRSGKSVLSKILPTLSHSEHLKVFTYFEHLMPGLRFKEIKTDFADSQLILMLNELAYNTFISRDVNFRPRDYTSVSTQYHKKKYLNRLKYSDGDYVINKLLKTKNFFPFMAHEIMPNIKFLNKLSMKFKIIEVYRNPVDNIFSWIQKKLDSEFYENPRSYTLVNLHKKKKLPWFCNTHANDWFKLNKFEKCTLAVNNLIEMSIKNQKINKKTKVLTISFEDFYQDPNLNVKKICTFLKTKTTKYTKSEIIKANCPREDDIILRNNKKQFIRERISKKLYEKMINLENHYENNVYGLK